MILFIDPTNKNIEIKLLDMTGQEVSVSCFNSDKNQTELLVLEIDRLLNKASLKLFDIKKIVVLKGPGSYTGLRVALSSLNAVAFAYDIFIYGYKEGELVMKEVVNSRDSHFSTPVLPYYLQPPKITRPKP